jgi:hypothetical protein
MKSGEERIKGMAIEAEEQVETESRVDEAGEAPGGEIPAPEAQAEAGEIQVQIGDEPPAEGEEQRAPAWVKKVRQRNRELERELREAKAKLNQAGGQEPTLGPKPTLEGMDYDAAKFEQALDEWKDSERKVKEKAAAAEAQEKTAEERWKGKMAAFEGAKTTLAAPDFDDAEAVVLDLLDVVQQGIIVAGAKDAALVIYALGKNESEARKLAAIKDPVEFAFAVARLEGQMKVTGRKPATAPEERISGNSRPSGTVDSTLDRLRAEAAKSGDMSKVLAYKNQHKQKRG